jgi:hypothetical protein
VIDASSIAFQHGLDGAVIVVPYPAGDTRCDSFALATLAIPHALYAALDDDASADHAEV